MLQIFDTGISSAEENMHFDAKLLEHLDPSGDSILHFYGWKNFSATYGYFIEPKNHLNLKKADFLGLDLARRPTGGGIVFHIWDLAFSFLMPSENIYFSDRPLENYQFVHKAVLESVKSYFALSPELIQGDAPSMGPDCKNFCMAKPTKYDVVYRGLKIAGAAQRKRRQGYLHQGTISLTSPNQAFLKEVLLSSQDVGEAMRFFTFAPVEAKDLNKARIEIQKLLAANLKKALEF